MNINYPFSITEGSKSIFDDVPPSQTTPYEPIYRLSLRVSIGSKKPRLPSPIITNYKVTKELLDNLRLKIEEISKVRGKSYLDWMKVNQDPATIDHGGIRAKAHLLALFEEEYLVMLDSINQHNAHYSSSSSSSSSSNLK